MVVVVVVLQRLPCLLANNIYANSCDSDFESDNKIQRHALVPDIIYIYPTRYNREEIAMTEHDLKADPQPVFHVNAVDDIQL